MDYYYVTLNPIAYNSKTNSVISDAEEVNIKKFLLVGKSTSEIFYRTATYVFTTKDSASTKNAVKAIGKNYNLNNFTGSVLFENLDENSFSINQYQSGNQIVPVKAPVNILAEVKTSGSYLQCTNVATCTYYTYCNNSVYVTATTAANSCPADPTFIPNGCQSFNGWHYSGTQLNTYCNVINYPDPPIPPPTTPPTSGGGGSSGGIVISDADIANSTYVDDGRPVIDPSKYIKCFQDGKIAAQYQLTLYVDQPIRGQNDWWSLDGYGEKFTSANGIKFDVGHAFVGFQKINTNGTSITQVMGFYPNPSQPVADGVIKDDSGHMFDVSYTVIVSASQFQAALTGVIYDNNSSKYVLTANLGYGSEYNCVDAARIWMLNASVNLPISTSRGVFLNSPGDYGQALRNFNGTNTTPGNAPNGHGPCN